MCHNLAQKVKHGVGKIRRKVLLVDTKEFTKDKIQKRQTLVEIPYSEYQNNVGHHNYYYKSKSVILFFRLKSQLQGGTSGEKKPILVVLEEIPASMLSQVNFFDMLVVLASIISQS